MARNDSRDTAPDKTPKHAKKRYITLTPFMLDNERIEIGETIELTPKEAEQHLATNSLTEA